MTLRVGEVFAGIGGFGKAFERAGCEVAWQIEIDPACCRVLARHWPDVRRYGDVRIVDATELETVDIVAFGSPCQDLSVAGKRGGLKGERSGLFYEAVRIVKHLRPALAVWENVPGALSSNGGRDFGAALDALADAGALDIAWRVLDAQWFGVAQRRRRLFVVADFGAERAGSVLFEPEGGEGHTPPRRATGARVAYALAASVRGTGDGHGNAWNSNYITQDVAASLTSGVNAPGRRREDDVNLVATALTSHHGRNDPTEETFVYQCHGSNVGEMGTLRSGNGHVTGGVPFTFAWQSGGDVRLGMREGDPGMALDTTGAPAVAFSWQASGSSDRTWIQRAGDYAGAMGATKRDAVAYGMAIRRLTPTECERLMGLPDGYTAGESDSARYRMLGNSVVVPCVEWIARRIVALGVR